MQIILQLSDHHKNGYKSLQLKVVGLLGIILDGVN
jgi:hypothetical protein